jgi:hypothetical protein
MKIQDKLKKKISKSIKTIIRSIHKKPISKYSAELSYWTNVFKQGNGTFNNSYYRRFMLAMAGKTDDSFLQGKIVADFGCGPQGSLVWASSASLRIGIDVLADHYADEFTDQITSYGMIYLKSTEKVIPLPSDFIDIMFTLNAIDHVDSFAAMSREIIRVIKPGGSFFGSFNLEEPATPCEPQKLNEKIIQTNLLKFLDVQSYRITQRGPQENPYGALFDGTCCYKKGQRGLLWVGARKK